MSLSKGAGMNPLDKLEQELKYINKTELGRRSFLGALPVLLASCATSRHRQREGDNTGQATSLSVEDEKKMTQQYIPKMRKDYPPLKNDKIQRYIASLGRKIASKNGLEGRPYNYNFSVVDTLSVPLREARESFEKEYLISQLKKFSGNISKTAKFVGMERSALHRKLKILGVKDLN